MVNSWLLVDSNLCYLVNLDLGLGCFMIFALAKVWLLLSYYRFIKMKGMVIQFLVHHFVVPFLHVCYLLIANMLT